MCMTSRDFCYWLQGTFEIMGDDMRFFDEKQVAIIKAHLNMVFEHEIDPSFPDKKILSELHEEGKMNAKIIAEKIKNSLRTENQWSDKFSRRIMC